MKNERLNEGSEPSPESAQEHSTADDLKFIRSVVEKTHTEIDPE